MVRPFPSDESESAEAGASASASASTSASSSVGSSGSRWVGTILAVLNAVLVLLYPLAVYFGLSRLSARSLGLLLCALLLPSLLWRLRSARRADLLAVLRIPLAVLAVVALGIVFDDKRFMLVMPVLINAALLVTFASSLRGTPMVERFARLQNPSLPLDHVPYCRAVTKVWCAFFAFNVLVCALLALYATLSSWALYTGLLAYLLMGALGAGEYVVRKARFREYGSGLHDRLIARLFPPPPFLAIEPSRSASQPPLNGGA
jgi:uncharacterized membrane protein